MTSSYERSKISSAQWLTAAKRADAWGRTAPHVLFNCELHSEKPQASPPAPPTWRPVEKGRHSTCPNGAVAFPRWGLLLFDDEHQIHVSSHLLMKAAAQEKAISSKKVKTAVRIGTASVSLPVQGGDMKAATMTRTSATLNMIVAINWKPVAASPARHMSRRHEAGR